MPDPFDHVGDQPRRRAWWKLHRMPASWKAILALAMLAAACLYLMAPGSPDVAKHESQAMIALLSSLAVSGLLALLAGMIHHGRKVIAGLLLLVVALLGDALLFAAYVATFGLFGF
ncbi:MAG: hypothetical protein JXQ91_20900 [Vannielia sp.]|uniref:hypothetical protein n=1 Tax=Vannielia sp. TaxID=2813045 RepID=UPI003B8E3DAC